VIAVSIKKIDSGRIESLEEFVDFTRIGGGINNSQQT